MSAKSRDLGKKLLLATGSVLVMLLLCEVVGSVYSALYYPRLTVTDATLGWKYKPTDGSIQRQDHVDEVNRLFINSDGFRDHEFSADEADLRIMVLGDSMTFGLEADQDEIYPSVLERSLQRRLGSSAIDVMNLGITGFGTAQESLALETYEPLYQPQVVLLMFFELNDFENNVTVFNNRFVPHFVPVDGGEPRLVDQPSAWQHAKNFLRDRSTVFFFLAHKLKMTRELMRESLDLDRAEAIDLTVDLLERIDRYAAERGIVFVLFYVRDETLPDDGQTAVRALARRNAIPYHEVPLKTEQRVGGRGHWNAEGHAAAAAVVEEALMREPSFLNLVGERSGPADAD